VTAAPYHEISPTGVRQNPQHSRESPPPNERLLLDRKDMKQRIYGNGGASVHTVLFRSMVQKGSGNRVGRIQTS